MKRFSRRNKKNVENGVKDNGMRNEASKTPSPHIEKSKTNLIKGFRKRFQSTRSSNTPAPKEHIYASAPSPVDMKNSPPTILNNNTSESNRPNGNMYLTPRPRAATVPDDDHDYSRVWNDEGEDDIGPAVPPRPTALSINDRDIYFNVSRDDTNSTVTQSTENGTGSPGTSSADSPGTSSAGSSGAVTEVTNINNSNDANSVANFLNGNANSVPNSQMSPTSSIIAAHPLMNEFHKLAKKGWYWGPLSREQAEQKLRNLPEASFLVRDSSDDRYLLSLSFRSNSRTLHTRIEHSGVKFSFYEDSPSQSYTSVIELIENSVRDSNEQGVFCYSRSRHPNAQTFPVRLMLPVSRFTEVRPLQDLCRFVIRQSTRIDHIQNLPVPNQIKGYLNQSYF